SYFNGSIDDLGVWDRALTACEISDLYNATSTLTTVSAGPDSTVCSGSAFVLSGSGASTYVWDNGVVNGVSFNPTSAQTYTVTGYNAAGCSAWDQVNISTIASQISAGPDQLICLGSSTTVQGSGGSNYSWNNGVTDGVPFVPTTTTYTVTGTGANGCVGSDQVNITQYLPLINAGPSSLNVCEGNAITLYGTGGVSYVWDNNVIDSVAFVPTTSTLYTVTGTDSSGCTNTDQIQVNVIPLPVVDAGPDLVICEGDQVTLTATGANGYSWSHNVQNNVPFTPTTTTTYTVLGADQNNCTGTDDVTVTVNVATTSTLDISAIDQYVLNGQTYSASGTYTQTLTNADGCDSIITLNLSLGFTGVDEANQFSVAYYPNPATNALFLELSVVTGSQLLEIYTAEGKLVQSKVITDAITQIDLSKLAKGYYIGHLNASTGNKTQFKFVKE
ncbi:MAG: T9SS type A sorting domain-containing protein, partial [Putridiphycobacter sp.]|nr:T9SS type A sorting domain-containing protein [Putridiphycobacter sp.]